MVSLLTALRRVAIGGPPPHLLPGRQEPRGPERRNDQEDRRRFEHGRHDDHLNREDQQRFDQDRRDAREDGWFQDDDFAANHRHDCPMHPRPVRLDFPRFDGDNPAAWTYKVNQFFDYYHTPLY